MTPSEITLREVTEADLPILFEQQRDPLANYMAAFIARDPEDRAAFMAHWAKIMADQTVINRVIEAGGKVVGSIACFTMFDERNVGYMLGREYWGQGIATRALQAFIELVRERPLYGRAARDNLASIRVLEKCGFRLTGYEHSFAKARGAEIDEAVLILEA